MRPFRFGCQYFLKATENLRDLVRRTEDLGFTAVFAPDHFSGTELATGPLLAAVAMLSDRLEVGSLVYGNDFRHPLLLAREVATLDVLSGGRAICGLGAGWYEGDYTTTGIPWLPAGERVDRLEEAIPIIQQAWKGESFSHQGPHYTVTDYTGVPKPSNVRLLIGGGGKRVLRLAGREADIVNLNAPLGKGFGKDMDKFTDDRLPEMLGWVREAGRDVELSVPVFHGAVTDRPEEAAQRPAEEMGYTVEQAMASPNFLFGTRSQVAERLHAYREKFGITTFILSQYGCDLDSFGSITREVT